ncbi:hypothetical protein [Aeromicrobium sp. Sec7.5]|uniref:hypothetical protein n=1 Tax=Aeromicrobium sp. Sec7.5 TaxID=3121276 RepID=UPI002FE4F845
MRELRDDAADVLRDVDLTGVFLMDEEFESRYRTGEFELVTKSSLETRAEVEEGNLLCWVRYEVWALIGDAQGLPSEPSEIDPEVMGERLAWRIACDWAAQYSVRDDRIFTEADLPKLAAFTLVMAPPTIHPYAREHIQSAVGKSLYPAFTLPHIRPITELPDDVTLDVED